MSFGSRIKTFFLGFSPIERLVGTVMLTTLPLWWYSNQKASKQLDFEKATKDKMQQQVTFDRFMEKYNSKNASKSNTTNNNNNVNHENSNIIAQSSTNASLDSNRSS